MTSSPPSPQILHLLLEYFFPSTSYFYSNCFDVSKKQSNLITTAQISYEYTHEIVTVPPGCPLTWFLFVSQSPLFLV